MATSTVEYIGNLRTRCTHLKSGQVLETDAPVDNNGKGSAFSPTDMLATSYASCMLTIVGIHCEQHEIDFTHAFATVTKEMASNPRRVARLLIEIDFTQNKWDEQTCEKIRKVAEVCPVAKSVHEDMIIEFTYTFS